MDAVGRSLLRTAITLIPWEATHLAYFALAPALGKVAPPQVVLASLANVLVAGYLIGTPADVFAGTEVRRRPPAPV